MPLPRFIPALVLVGLAHVAAPAAAGAQVSTAPQKDAVTRSDEAFAKGVALHQAGDIIGAIDAYDQALKLTPWRLEVWSLQAMAQGQPARVWRPSSP